MLTSGQQKGTGGGRRNNIGANEAAARLLVYELMTTGFCCASETKYLMEANGWEYHTAMKVPHSVQTLLYYSNIYDLEEFYYRPPKMNNNYRPSNATMFWEGYKALRWRVWSKREDLRRNWACLRRGGKVRNNDGSLRDEVLEELDRLKKDAEKLLENLEKEDGNEYDIQ